jgi:hypothetical protein
MIQRLQQWYQQRCDGEWEHRHGVSIQSCDNPGWWVKVDLRGTALLDKPYLPVSENAGNDKFPCGNTWLDCRVEDGFWQGAGDEAKLERILEAFLDWAESTQQCI